MIPIPLLLGAGFLLLAKKKPSKQQTVAAKALLFSRDALAASQAPQEEAQAQWALVHDIVTEVQQVGTPPYDLEKNWPSPQEVAILYNLDPTFTIKGKGGSVGIDVLLAMAQLQDPSIDSYAAEKELDVRIRNVLSILSPAQNQSFAHQTVERYLGSRPITKFSPIAYDLLRRSNAIGIREIEIDRLDQATKVASGTAQKEILQRQMDALIKTTEAESRQMVLLLREAREHSLIDINEQILIQTSSYLNGDDLHAATQSIRLKAQIKALQQNHLLRGIRRFADKVNSYLQRANRTFDPPPKKGVYYSKYKPSVLEEAIEKYLAKPYKTKHNQTKAIAEEFEEEATWPRLQKFVKELP